MTQITLKIDDSIGKQQIENKIGEWLKELKRKIDLQEATEELALITPVNDAQWQISRTLAWETYKHNFEEKAQ